MIKELIKDIAYDTISLSQGLTRAKLIAVKIKNDVFRQWLSKELEGYDYNYKLIPSHRKLKSEIHFEIELPFKRLETFPYILSDSAKKDKEFAEMINFHIATEPISIVEKNLAGLNTQQGKIPLSQDVTDSICKQYESQVASYRGVIRGSYRLISRSQYEAIIELTKQKLLDTLLELDKEFPNLENDFIMNKENEDKVHNIITNNIYGSNNPVNVAAGQKVVQKDISINFSNIEYEQLEKLGVNKEEILELKQIIEINSENKSALKDKAMKWLGSVSAAIAGRGIYENIPAITEFIQKLI